MTYSPPGSTALHFDFIDVQWCILAFNFDDLYSPPAWNALRFNFTISLFPIDFEFAPEVPPPISKDMLLALGIRYHGQVYKYWICQMSHGTQQVRRYKITANPRTADQQANRSKFTQAVSAALALDDESRVYWGKIGIHKKKPLPWWNAFISAWMRDKIK